MFHPDSYNVLFITSNYIEFESSVACCSHPVRCRSWNCCRFTAVSYYIYFRCLNQAFIRQSNRSCNNGRCCTVTAQADQSYGSFKDSNFFHNGRYSCSRIFPAETFSFAANHSHHKTAKVHQLLSQHFTIT
jgi:hypothetical protein